MVTQHALRFSNQDTENNEILEWCAGTIVTVINGRNLKNGNKLYRNLGAAEVRWRVN